jgi:hypothetical protein
LMTATAWLIVLCATTTAFADTSGQSVLLKLTDFDSLVLDDFTLRAEVLHPQSHRPKPDSERLFKDVTITSKDGVWAARSDISDEKMAPPKYPGLSQALQSEDYDRSGNILVWRPTCRSVLYEEDLRGVYRTTRLFRVSPTGPVAVEEAPDTVELYRPEGALEQADIYISVLASGRGFSRLVDAITEAVVSRENPKLLDCKAVGRYPDGTRCIWQLAIEPDATYIVRKAKCVREDNGFVLADMENFGTKWFEKGPVPERARYIFAPKYYGTSPESAFEITYMAWDDKTDEDLIDRNRRLLRSPYPPGTTVLDYRVNSRKPLRYDVRDGLADEDGLLSGLSKAADSGGKPAGRTGKETPAVAMADANYRESLPQNADAPGADAPPAWTERLAPVGIIVLGATGGVLLLLWRRRNAS